MFFQKIKFAIQFGIKFGIKIGLISAFFSLAFFPMAKATGPTDASRPLYRQVDLLEEIEPYVERIDLARLFLIKTSVKTVISNMETNLAGGKHEVTMETMRLLQNLILQYRFSSVFFGWQEPMPITSIYAPVIGDELNELHKLSDDLVTEYGFDDSPYTQITANTFRQMQKLLQQLESLPIDAQLKTDLHTLWPSIGETIAIAEQGDRPKTFEKAVPVIGQIRSMYAEFNRIASSDAGFPLIMEFQGLAEFYAEFAQMP